MALGLLNQGSQAQEVLSRWIRVDGYTSTKTLDDRQGAGSLEVGIKYAHGLGPDDKLRLEAKLMDDVRDHHSRLRVADAYWQHRGESVDWRIGQQRVAWGKADGVNPTDFFTPHDYTVLQPFEADQRLSVPALRSDIAVSDHDSLSVVVVPEFIRERQPQPLDTPIEERRPDGRREPQVGVRWSSTGDMDWSISAFHGFLNTPLLAVDRSPAAATPLFHHYARLTAVGADVARNFGRWGFRAEAAWLDPSTEEGRPGIKPHAFIVAGVDRGTPEWNVNVQAIVRHTPGWAPPAATADPLAAAAEQQNAITFGQRRRTQWGMTARLSANWLHETLQAEVLVLQYFAPANALVRPLITYALSDTVRLAVGGEIYRGPQDTFFGQLRRNRSAFVEYQQFF